MENICREKLEAMKAELVPERGPAPTVAGEIVRAVSAIWECYDASGGRIGTEGSGCDAAARYLIAACDISTSFTVWQMMGYSWWISELVYRQKLDEITCLVLGFLADHPDLRGTVNHEDMLDYDPGLSVPEV